MTGSSLLSDWSGDSNAVGLVNGSTLAMDEEVFKRLLAKRCYAAM